MSDYTKDELHALVLQKYLAGVRGPKAIAVALEVPEQETWIANHIGTEGFQVALKRAKRDMASSIVDTIKGRMHAYLDELEKLALTCTDPRIKVAALRDLLDRGGTGGMQKVSLTSPAAYKKALEEFTDEEKTDELPVDGPKQAKRAKVRQSGNGADVDASSGTLPASGD